MNNTLALAIVAVLFSVSSVMAMAETAFTRASRIKLRGYADAGDSENSTICPTEMFSWCIVLPLHDIRAISMTSSST